MIQSLTAVGFRCFREIRVKPLTRVNLFVGENNAGKTSLLEAVELVAVGGVEGLARSAARRSEHVLARSENGGEFGDYVLDPMHLFFGHGLHLGTSFKIHGDGEPERWVTCTVEQSSRDAFLQSLVVESHRQSAWDRLTISPLGGMQVPPRHWPEPSPRVNFLAAESIDLANLGQFWDDLVLTPAEAEVIESLKVVEPHLEKLAFLSESRGNSVPVVKLEDSEQRLPLGSLGGGLRHLLALVLNLLSARGGFFLIDEIDTGLHYSVMLDMWRLLVESAKRLDVQVFATTHSLDCVSALAQLRRKHPELAAEVTVHRVEKDASRTIVYDADEIVVAADSHIEVR